MIIRDFIVDPNQPKENFQPENMANLVYSSLTPLKVTIPTIDISGPILRTLSDPTGQVSGKR